MNEFIQLIKNRRTNYVLSNEKIVSEKEIEQIIKDAIKYVPTAFNIQSSKVVVLFNEQHENLWDIVKRILQKRISPQAFIKTEQKINSSFRSGYGTIMFFDDTDLTKQLQTNYPSYKDNFPIWAEQANGMLQFTIWTALCNKGLGVSLQHYNPIIDDEVKKNWKIPAHYKLIAQMPFGKPAKKPLSKTFEPLESRIKIYK